MGSNLNEIVVKESPPSPFSLNFPKSEVQMQEITIPSLTIEIPNKQETPKIVLDAEMKKNNVRCACCVFVWPLIPAFILLFICVAILFPVSFSVSQTGGWEIYRDALNLHQQETMLVTYVANYTQNQPFIWWPHNETVPYPQCNLTGVFYNHSLPLFCYEGNKTMEYNITDCLDCYTCQPCTTLTCSQASLQNNCGNGLAPFVCQVNVDPTVCQPNGNNTYCQQRDLVCHIFILLFLYIKL